MSWASGDTSPFVLVNSGVRVAGLFELRHQETRLLTGEELCFIYRDPVGSLNFLYRRLLPIPGENSCLQFFTEFLDLGFSEIANPKIHVTGPFVGDALSGFGSELRCYRDSLDGRKEVLIGFSEGCVKDVRCLNGLSNFCRRNLRETFVRASDLLAEPKGAVGDGGS